MPIEIWQRPLTDDERALASRRRLEVREGRLARLRAELAEPAWLGGIALAVGLGAALGLHVWAGYVMAGFGVLFLGLVPVAWRRRGRAALDQPTGWDEPPEGWSVEETRLRPRRLARAIDANGDGVLWLLYDLGEPAWAFLDAELFRDGEVARTEVQLTRLTPGGQLLAARTTGEPIPVVGSSGLEADIDRDVAADYCWAPPDDLAPGASAVEAERLPGWMRG